MAVSIHVFRSPLPFVERAGRVANWPNKRSVAKFREAIGVQIRTWDVFDMRSRLDIGKSFNWVCILLGGPGLRRAHGLHTRETYPETYPVAYPRNCR